MLRVGVIGYGYWGPNLVRNFYESGVSTVTAVSDLSADRLEIARARYPVVKTTTSHEELFSDPNIDAIAIATPVATHHRLALAALKSGKHVFVEKPLTATVAEGRELIEEADRRNLILMVDHTFIYTGAVRKMRELVDTKALGDIYYYDSVRVNLGLFQADVSVLWDLAVHDLAIMSYLFPHAPVAVSATGMAHVPGKPINVAYLTVFFEGTVVAHIHVNWLSPVKIRHTLLGGSKKMVLYDDLEPSEKIRVYDKGVTMNGDSAARAQALVDYRVGDMFAPYIDKYEPLAEVCREFLDAIVDGTRPLTDGESGLDVVRVLEAAQESIRKEGERIPVESSS